MSTFLTIVIIYTSYKIGKGVLSRLKKRRKRIKEEKKEKEKEMLRQKPKPTQKQLEAQQRAERLKELKANMEKSETRVDAARLRSTARKDKLMGRSGWDETNLHYDWVYRFLLTRQAKAEIVFKADRSALHEHLLSTATRPKDSSQKLFSIRCNKLSDGTLTFELPYDAGASIINEMKIALSRDWGVALGDLNRARVTEHRANDFSTISLGNPRTGMEKDILSSTVFIFNRAKGTISPAGEQLTPGTVNKIYQAMDEFRTKVREQAKEPHTFLDREETKSFITLHTLGLDTVALAYNGVAIAYATASPDGGIHMKGDDVPVGDKKALKMASAVQEKLQDCSIFGQWLDKAIEILKSPENIQAGVKEVERKASLERSMLRMKETAKRVIESPKTALKRVSPKR